APGGSDDGRTELSGSLAEDPAKGAPQRRGAVALEPAAMGEDDPFRLPRQHPFDRGAKLRSSEASPQVAWRLAVGMLRAADPEVLRHRLQRIERRVGRVHAATVSATRPRAFFK